MKKLYLFFAVLCVLFGTQTANAWNFDGSDPSSIQLRGPAFGDSNWTGLALTWDATKKVYYRNDVTITPGGEFKLYINTDYKGNGETVSFKTYYTFSENGNSNAKLNTSGFPSDNKVRVEVTGDNGNPKLYITDNPPSTCYVIGNDNSSWNLTTGDKLTTSSSGIFTGTVTFVAGELFVVSSVLGNSSGDWDTVNTGRYGAESDQQTVTVGSEMNITTNQHVWKVSSAGTYTITVNFNTMKLKLEAASSDPTVTSRTLTKISLLQGSTEVASSTGSPYTFSSVAVTAGTAYQIAATYAVNYSDNTTKAETVKYYTASNPTLGTAATLTETESSTFTFSESATVSATVTVSDSKPTAVTFTEVTTPDVPTTYPQVALLNNDGANVVAYFTQDATNSWLWKLDNQTIIAADNDNANSKYRFRVYTSASIYTDYTHVSGVSNENWWITDESVFDLAQTASGNICVSGKTTACFAVSMLDGALVQAVIGTTDQSSKLSEPRLSITLEKVTWDITKLDEYPAVFLVGGYQNNWVATPSYQFEKQSDGSYILENFVMVPDDADSYGNDKGFKIVVYNDANSSGAWYSVGGDISGLTFDSDATYNISTSNSGNTYWKNGQTMVKYMKINSSLSQLTVNIDGSYPSTAAGAPIAGVPFVSLVGDKFTQGEELTTRNSGRSESNVTAGTYSTSTGWQEGFIEYTADGKVYVTTDGRPVYSTIWPPRNPISFDNDGWEFSSDDITFKYAGKKKRSEANTTDTDANADTQEYAVYEIPYVWMEGAYKIWTGWGGMLDREYQPDATNMWAEWRSHYNWGYLGWDGTNSTTVNTDTFYPMNGKQGNAAGGNFNFDDRYYFSKVELWYNLSDPHGTQKSYFIAYLANGDPIVSIKRTGKAQVTGTYKVNMPETTDRGISSWKVELFKENGDEDILISTVSGGETNAETLTSDKTTVTDGLESGVYYYKMTVNYPAHGDVAAETLIGESTRVRIFGVVTPTNVSVKQLTETGSAGETLYSFDLEINAAAPTDLLNVKRDGENSTEDVLNLVKAYVVSIPKHASGLFTAVEGATEITTDSYNSNDLYLTLDTDTYHYFAIAPNTDSDYAMPAITLRNVIPGNYTVNVQMVASDGDYAEWEQMNVSYASASVEMVIPGSQYTASQFAIAPVDATSENIADAHLPLGTSTSQPVEYQKSNKLSTTDGKFSQLAVTNSVLNNWAMTYTVTLTDANDSDATYTYTLGGISGKALNAAGGVSAQFDRLPIPYEEGEATLTSAQNSKIKAIKPRKAKDGNLKTVTSVGYKRTVTGYTTDEVAKVEATASTADILLSSNVENGTALSEYNSQGSYIYQTQKSYNWEDETITCFANAFASLTWTPVTALHNAAGYYAASTHNGNMIGYTIVDPTDGLGYVTQNFPAEGGEVTYGSAYSEAYRLDGYDPTDATDTDNFAEVAASKGKLPIKVWYVGDGDGKPSSTLEVALTADYPVLIAPSLTATLTSVSEVSTASVDDGVFTATGVTEKMITLSYPELRTQDLNGTTTDITDIAADGAGDFRIYPNPAVDVVNVAASAALGRVEIYSVDGRLVKVVEVDDTHATIEVGDLVKGSYIVRAAGATERLIKR